MRALILSISAAAVLALGLTPQTASAAWTVQTTTRFDPACQRSVTVTERVWVPEPVVVVAPPVVVVRSPIVVAPPICYPEFHRGYYGHEYHYEHEHHHY